LETLTHLLKLRNRIQSEIGTASRDAKRHSLTQDIAEAQSASERSGAVAKSSRRFSQSLERASLQHFEEEKENIHKIIQLENVKELTRQVRAKMKMGDNEAAQFLSTLDTSQRSPAHRRNTSVTKLTRRHSHEPPRPCIRTNQVQKKTTTWRPRWTSSQPIMGAHDSTKLVKTSSQPPEAPETFFRHIDIPKNFVIFDDSNLPDCDQVRISIQNLRDTCKEDISETLVEKMDPLTADTTPSLERRDPSRAIERRRAALAALRLRYNKLR
jgi:hypothetical protein